MFSGVFVCLIVCLFVCLFDCLFNCLCVCLFVCETNRTIRKKRTQAIDFAQCAVQLLVVQHDLVVEQSQERSLRAYSSHLHAESYGLAEWPSCPHRTETNKTDGPSSTRSSDTSDSTSHALQSHHIHHRRTVLKANLRRPGSLR